jgi:hypothetical protein
MINCLAPGPCYSDNNVCVWKEGKCPMPDPPPPHSLGESSVEVQWAWRKPRNGQPSTFRTFYLRVRLSTEWGYLCSLLWPNVNPFITSLFDYPFHCPVNTSIYIPVTVHIFFQENKSLWYSTLCIDPLSTPQKTLFASRTIPLCIAPSTIIVPLKYH